MSYIPELQQSEGRASDSHVHDRRYRAFVAVFGAVVLLFAAISITVVVLTS